MADIGRFEAEFLDYIQRDRPGIYDALRETNELSEDTITALKDAIDQFRRGFETSDGRLLVVDEPVGPAEESEIVHEGVTRHVTVEKKEAQ